MTAQPINFSKPTPTHWPDAPRDFGHGATQDWMGPIGTTVTQCTPLNDAIRLMLSSDRDHLIVTNEDGLLVGVVADRAVIGLIADGAYQGPDTIESLVNTAPTTVDRSTPFAAALRLLDPPEVTCVVVVHGGRPVGLISETHLASPTLALVAASL
ncbi:MAG: CBS domain-containing protein [Myxococcota bacterium]